MLDFSLLKNKEVTMADLCRDLTVADLRNLTHEMVDTMLELIAACTDKDVTFVPQDPDAYDPVAATESELEMAWTLGHVIVHTTATAEEAAFIAAEMARGVNREGRSRYETPWESVTTIAQCRDRLEESRRMRLATLEVWPDRPHWETTVELGFLQGPLNPAARFATGLMHDHSHLEQIANIVEQAKIVEPG